MREWNLPWSLQKAALREAELETHVPPPMSPSTARRGSGTYGWISSRFSQLGARSASRCEDFGASCHGS